MVSCAEISQIFEKMSAHREAGRALPREAYLDQGLYDHELVTIFFSKWLFAGHACEIPRPGDYVTFELDCESFILIRGEDGKIYAHANVCRHRGSRICAQPDGHAGRLVCPYHQWSYRPNGTLTSAACMGDAFDPAKYPLRSVHVRDVGGLLFVCLADSPPEFGPAFEAIEPQIRLNQLDQALVCCHFDYEVPANWKLVVENNRECYHCGGNHPEFCRSNYDVGMNGDDRVNHQYREDLERQSREWERIGLYAKEISFPDGAWYRVTRFPLKSGYLSESLDGRVVAPLMGNIPAPHTGSLRIVALPNAWIHVNCDYAVSTRILPVSPQRTLARVTFLVDGAAVPGVDFNTEQVAAVWKATSEQDWELCRQTQQGVNSRFYTPGPYSPLTEASLMEFIDWYFLQISNH